MDATEKRAAKYHHIGRQNFAFAYLRWMRGMRMMDPDPKDFGVSLTDAQRIARKLAEVEQGKDELPPCAREMGCLCAGHARGAPASAACDTTE